MILVVCELIFIDEWLYYIQFLDHDGMDAYMMNTYDYYFLIYIH